MKHKYILKILFLVALCVLVASSSTLNIISCVDLSCDVRWDKIRYFPYPDFAENISGAMNSAKNEIFGSDFAHPHAPGIYILLGLLYKLTAVNDLVQSPFSAIVWVYLSILGLSLFVCTIYWRVYGFYLSIITFLLIVVIGYKQNLVFVMSETIAFWLAIPLTTLAIRYNKNENNSTPEFLLFSLPIIILFCGVGFPSLILMPLAILLIKLRSSESGEYFAIAQKLVPAGLLILVCAYLLIMYTEIHNLKYWVVDVNKTVRPQLINNVIANLLMFDKPMYLVEILLYLPFEFGILFYAFKKGVISRVMLIILIFCCIGGLWRVSFGYKALPNAGIVIAVLLALIESWSFINKKFKCILYIIFPMAIITTYLLFNLLLNKSFANHDAIFFEDSDICKLTGQNSAGCKCVTFLVFGPQIFIQNDIKQCKNQMNTWADAMGEDDRYFNVAKITAINKESIYIVPPSQFINKGSRLESLVEIIHDNYVCKSVKVDWQICK
ncbi:hypothetical protein LMORI2_02720 [Limnohabitans sp. MORI2]|uniref:hypothetical protein n=1 Tax=Limnohabitans sp. MORI2 TaxID=1751150 RepID=UPI002377B2F0|nr:hypothetical protein [Limnohabitans sp. MORI2]BDU57290.1 hypothetical protein LMORI2_02720 [Limnohabitans sp. MORI2]